MITRNEMRFLVLHEGSRFSLKRILHTLILSGKIGDVKIGDVKIVAMRIVSMQVGGCSSLSKTSAAHAAEPLRGRVLPAACVTANERRMNLDRRHADRLDAGRWLLLPLQDECRTCRRTSERKSSSGRMRDSERASDEPPTQGEQASPPVLILAPRPKMG